MKYSISQVDKVASALKERLSKVDNKSDILKAPELRDLLAEIPKQSPENRASFGKEVNLLRAELAEIIDSQYSKAKKVKSIDISAPFDINCPPEKRPFLINTKLGGKHPIMSELDKVLDIFYRMGFTAIESRQLDDDYHILESLNFPLGHPARDDFDTFTTSEGLIPPAQTSTMQNRVLKKFSANLKKNKPIAVVIPGRVYRNEDLDPRHEHTFYQLEGVYVSKGVTVGNLISTLKVFLEEYYEQNLNVKIQPFYFPFTEPSFEFALSCPFCKGKGCNVCSYSGWIELLGCGLIHPNVLKMAGIDPEVYTGFAWGGGIDRLVMMKYDIDDIRYFESARLDFLRQFK